ncbi:MAG: nucleotidyl transferase AbiEii/AbiGii toxin family protein [Candidatus Eisenbacteria sp.]|nr:nucleotidyl transferase AbiEii/AbiGii toxin family protein [Candidatus Eisenbacteria bacterium]
MNEQLEFLKIIGTRLASANVPYMLTGSLAMAMYAEPRMTRDIDIVIEYRPRDSNRIAQLFEDISYVDSSRIEEAARHEGMFNILHNEWIIKADFIARKSGAYRVLEFSRRREIDVEGVNISVVSPEDLVLSKLDWAKASSSELQMRDVRTIVAFVTDLDLEYLRKWAQQLGLTQLLDEATGL